MHIYFSWVQIRTKRIQIQKTLGIEEEIHLVPDQIPVGYAARQHVVKAGLQLVTFQLFVPDLSPKWLPGHFQTIYRYTSRIKSLDENSQTGVTVGISGRKKSELHEQLTLLMYERKLILNG